MTPIVTLKLQMECKINIITILKEGLEDGIFRIILNVKMYCKFTSSLKIPDKTMWIWFCIQKTNSRLLWVFSDLHNYKEMFRCSCKFCFPWNDV